MATVPRPKRKLIPGMMKRQARRAEDLEERRWTRPLAYCRSMAEDGARRVAESRKLFPWKFLRGDCHLHTQHSDGIGTVEETAEMVAAAGLDFQFVTDHWGVTQDRECRRHGLWFGQEPGAHQHHLGILGLDHAYKPGSDLVADFIEVRRRGGTPYIPHPAGWWPRRVYTDEAKNALNALPSPFLMEVINGAGNMVTAFDYTDAMAVELWDRLLLSGRRVHAMANTDAHMPHQVGIAWTGVFAPRCDVRSVLKALNLGRCFASEAPLLNLTVGGVGMGGGLSARGRATPLSFTVVESRGLQSVRLVADGKVRRRWRLDGRTRLDHRQILPPGWVRYVRVEAVTLDGRRGFSNPVYL